MVGSGYGGCEISVNGVVWCRGTGNKLFHVRSSWRVNKQTEEAVAVEVGGLSRDIMTLTEMVEISEKALTRTLSNSEWVSCQA